MTPSHNRSSTQYSHIYTTGNGSQFHSDLTPEDFTALQQFNEQVTQNSSHFSGLGEAFPQANSPWSFPQESGPSQYFPVPTMGAAVPNQPQQPYQPRAQGSAQQQAVTLNIDDLQEVLRTNIQSAVSSLKTEIRYARGNPSSNSARSSRLVSSTSRATSNNPAQHILNDAPEGDEDNKIKSMSLGDQQLDITAHNIAHLEAVNRGGFPDFVVDALENLGPNEIHVPSIVTMALNDWRGAVENACTPDSLSAFSPDDLVNIFSSNTAWWRGNCRKHIAGMVSIQEDWTSAQRANSSYTSIPDRLWRSKFPLNYGLNGLDSPPMVEKTLNRIRVEDLLNPQLYPFLHVVENGRIVKPFGNPIYLQAVLTIAFGRHSSAGAVGSLFKSTIPDEVWAFAGMILFSIIDRYRSGVRTAHHLSEANYGHVFRAILEGIRSLQGQALSDFQEMGKTLFIHAYTTVPMPGPSTMQSCPVA